MEALILGGFCAALLACLLADIPLLYALAFGLVLFWLYGLRRGFGPRALWDMTLEGVIAVRNILITFVLIGILTALWRAAGTVPEIVSLASGLIRPGLFLVMTFLLNGAVSVLTGTAFGTAATMGVICATMGAAMGIDARLVGGAVLSGAFFGDRCSPVSTSALLVAELAGTDIYDNLRAMARSALAPFLMALALFGAAGLFLPNHDAAMDLRALFSREFRLTPLLLLPAAVILLLAAFRVKVRLAMTASIAAAAALCLFVQKTAPADLLRMCVTGFQAADPEVGRMLSGGGITSMLRVGGIVCLSSAYSGIFRKTGLLDGARGAIERLAGRTTPYAAVLLTSVAAGAVACNQTLAILLTDQLCAGPEPDPRRRMLDLEDSAVVTSPLIPWSIASATPLAAVGAPAASVLCAWYLILLPLWRLGTSFAEKLRDGTKERRR